MSDLNQVATNVFEAFYAKMKASGIVEKEVIENLKSLVNSGDILELEAVECAVRGVKKSDENTRA